MDKINVAVGGSMDTDTGQKTPTLMQQLDSMSWINLNAYYCSDSDTAGKVLEKAGLCEDG